MIRRAPAAIATIGAVLFTALILLRVWPHAPLRDRFPISTTVWSADGQLLRVTRASDDQYRIWTPLSDIAPAVVDAFLLKEDRWFYWNPGVNPIALARAASRTYRGGVRQGGSTVTMQLARLTYRLDTKSPAGKLRQVAAALWLEARYSKRELLEAYLNVVPFGGNIQGVGAASRLYFGMEPSRLSLGQALTLAVIPQHPSARAGRNGSDGQLLAARAALGRLWLAAHPGDADAARQVALPIGVGERAALPQQAPHFVDALLADPSRKRGAIQTTLDSGLQRLVETQVERYLKQHGDRGIHNVAALLLDSRDMSVKAWVGSADYWNADIDGQVNGVTARRSPGSTLKPFVYALGVDQGVLHPRTMLRDAPTAFGPFAPENFDGQFMGPISAQDALVRSRNVPAVWVASRLSEPGLYQFLQSAGVRGMKSEGFYGLALPLGGGELTMEELATLYAMLANQGELQPIRRELSSPRVNGPQLLSPEAAFVTLDMLQHNPRPDGEAAAIALRTRWPVAWKTGTSWGFRDAWSAGVAGPYVLTVWIGDFAGKGNPAFVGVDAAAPLFFHITDALNAARPAEAVEPLAPPRGVKRVAVCVDSGDLPNVYCPRTIETWYIPGRSPIQVSQLHRAVALDARSGLPVCPPYAADTRFEVFEFWSSDLLKLFRQAGMPRRTPPPLPACATSAGSAEPRIASPLRSVTYALRRSRQEGIALEAESAADVRRLFWFDGGALIGSYATGDGAPSWQPAAAGIHVIRVVDDHGRSAERDVDVRFTN